MLHATVRSQPKHGYRQQCGGSSLRLLRPTATHGRRQWLVPHGVGAPQCKAHWPVWAEKLRGVWFMQFVACCMLHAACCMLQCKAQWPACAEMIPSLFGDSAIDPHQIVRALSRRSQRCVLDVSYLSRTSAPGLGLPQPHLHRGWADRCNICTRDGLTPATPARPLRAGR